MIRYDLKCNHAHAFDAWFASSESFDAQAGAGKLACPVCGSTSVEKALMAPRLSKGAPAAKEKRAPTEKVGLASGAGQEAEAALAKLRAFVEANCEDVGGRFPEEARKIHYREAEQRGIYGEATPEEAKELAEEGIPVGRLPWRTRHDA